jgi:hypothetical protein
MTKKGLYANIHAKQQRIAEGFGERMRKPSAKALQRLKLFVSQLKPPK